MNASFNANIRAFKSCTEIRQLVFYSLYFIACIYIFIFIRKVETFLEVQKTKSVRKDEKEKSF